MKHERPWPAELTKATGRQVRKYRTALNLTAEELANRVSETFGFNYTRAQVTNLESNRRTSITVGEVIALGAVLGVPPAVLVVPPGDLEDVEMRPGRTYDTWNAYCWFTDGGELLGDDLPRDQDDIAKRLSIYRAHDNDLMLYAVERRDEQVSLPPRSLQLLVRSRDRIRDQGWRLPDLPPEIAAEVETFEKGAQR